MSPWFHAKLWLVRAGMNAHAAGVAQVAGVAPPVVLEATHLQALEWVALDDLRRHEVTT